ncbi:MAG: hypothetical protein AB2L12_08275 [Smithellaceae bacterium]
MKFNCGTIYLGHNNSNSSSALLAASSADTVLTLIGRTEIEFMQ